MLVVAVGAGRVSFAAGAGCITLEFYHAEYLFQNVEIQMSSDIFLALLRHNKFGFGRYFHFSEYLL